MTYYRNSYGGKNRTHGQVEKVPRVNAAELAEFMGWGWLTIEGTTYTVETLAEAESCDIIPPWASEPVTVALDRVPTVGGAEHIYFKCPGCGHRVRYLYFTKSRKVCCRTCAGLNYRRQQLNVRDSTFWYALGCGYAEAFLGVERRDFPDGFGFTSWRPPRPKGMHRKTYEKHLLKLADYQIKQGQLLAQELRRVMKSLG